MMVGAYRSFGSLIPIYSDGPRLRKITECTEASTPRVSRDNLDDVLEHENLENLDIEDLQVVDEDDKVVFSIEEVEMKEIKELKDIEDDSEDSEGGDLFSLSSELSFNNDFDEITDNNQAPDEDSTRNQDGVEVLDAMNVTDSNHRDTGLDFGVLIDEILDEVFEIIESKEVIDEGFDSSKSLSSIGEISTKKPRTYEFGFLDEKSVETIKTHCSSKEADEGIFCALEPLTVDNDDAYVVQLSDLCIFESDQERFEYLIFLKHEFKTITKNLFKSSKKKRKSVIDEINRSKDFEKVESKGNEN